MKPNSQITIYTVIINCPFILLVFLLFHLNTLFAGNFLTGPEYLISETLENTTFKIQGAGHKRGTITYGTVFMMIHEFPGMEYPPGKSSVVLFTAAHVLEGIKGDEATIFYRKKIGKIYKKVAYDFPIRVNNTPLWIKHPEVDIAIMLVHGMPEGLDLTYISTSVIATDEIFENKNIVIGDKLFVLGYPLGIEANDAGFPILRVGAVASYPLSPITHYKTFLLDFDVYEGNSGGPVFVQNRFSYGEIKLKPFNYLLGIVIQNYREFKEIRKDKDLEVKEDISKTTEVEKIQDLGLAVVVHAQYIKELLQKITVEKINNAYYFKWAME